MLCDSLRLCNAYPPSLPSRPLFLKAYALLLLLRIVHRTGHRCYLASDSTAFGTTALHRHEHEKERGEPFVAFSNSAASDQLLTDQCDKQQMSSESLTQPVRAGSVSSLVSFSCVLSRLGIIFPPSPPILSIVDASALQSVHHNEHNVTYQEVHLIPLVACFTHSSSSTCHPVLSLPALSELFSFTLLSSS